MRGALRRTSRWRSPRPASVRGSLASRSRPASGPPGCWPATGGPPAIAAAARRSRSAPRTGRCARHLPRTAARARRGVRPSRPQTRAARCGEPGCCSLAGMRRSEVSALRWSDVVDATDGDGVLVAVRCSKTNHEGETNDVRFVKAGVARSIRTLRAFSQPGAGLPCGAVVGADDRPELHGRSACRRRRAAGDGALGAGRAGERVVQPGRVDHRRDAGRELKDQSHGGALLRRAERGTRRPRTPYVRCSSTCPTP